MATMIRITAAVASLLATQALANPGNAVEEMSGRKMLETRLEHVADDTLQRRQASDQMDMTAWNTETGAACTEALSGLSAATNPSGTAACYNLPSLNTNTGTFMADLRLYQVSTPFGDFEGIPPASVSGGVQFSGATVRLVSQEVNQRDLSSALAKRQTKVEPTLLQTYMFEGEINQDKMVQPMTLGAIEPLVMPTVTLTATNAAGGTVSTNVSSNEAAFVNGIFSHEVIMSDFSRAGLAVTEATEELRNGTIAFIVPGVNILIFPVGLVVTSLWTALGLAAYGYGTYQRYGFRDAYRSRKARSSGPGYGARI